MAAGCWPEWLASALAASVSASLPGSIDNPPWVHCMPLFQFRQSMPVWVADGARMPNCRFCSMTSANDTQGNAIKAVIKTTRRPRMGCPRHGLNV
ncbi:hypothetical protein C7401_13257 [Paraburkholderia unamae]|nr:hypothetical protein C7401_13257 [Paraburkholderia unamae]